jgi:predicted transcriptional regulator
MTQSYHNYTTIYTAFAQSDKLPHLVKLLYLFVRSYDRQSFVKRGKKGTQGKGSGIVVLDIPTIAATLNRKESTIKKNLRLALKLGVFWMLEIKGKCVRLVYSALTKLCSQLGISNLGAIHEEKATELDNIRTHNIRATVAQKQRNAQQGALRKTKEENELNQGKKLTRRVVKPSKIFKNVSILSDRDLPKEKVEKTSGIKAFRKVLGTRFLLVNRQFVPYGVSQETIGKLVNRTPQTVRKHLNAINDLPPIECVQICYPSNDAIRAPEFWLDHNLGEKHYLRFKGDRELYQVHTNIYNLEVDATHLLGCVGLRRRISKATRKSQHSSPVSTQA